MESEEEEDEGEETSSLLQSPGAEDGATPPPPRRSSRRRFRPLEYWRGERLVYQLNPASDSEVPEVVGIETLGTVTPQRSHRPRAPTAGPASNDPAALPPPRLPVGSDSALLPPQEGLELHSGPRWLIRASGVDEPLEPPASFVVNRCAERALLSVEGGSLTTAQSVMKTGSISGVIHLPPLAGKEESIVEDSLMVLHVRDAQDDSVELSIQNQYALLSLGDQAIVPPFNVYAIRNLSQEVEAVLDFTIVSEALRPSS